jgi:phosphatidylserine/phosphatidylglycerophosphate/cardiolipin synthase-like enzyme
MNWLLRVLAGFALLILVFITVITVLSKNLVPHATSINPSEVSRLLEPFSWIHPNKAFSKEENFSLQGRPPFQVISSRERDIFDFNTGEFIEAQKASSFREAQFRYFKRVSLDPYLNRYAYEAPHMRSWGALPYPPIRYISQLNAEAKPVTETWANHGEYQQELDRITGHELTRNESVEIVQNGKVVAPVLKIITDAKQFVFVNVLSLVCDASTEPVIHALEERAKSGVDVRVIVNQAYAALAKPCLQRMRDHQIQIATAPTHSSYYINDQDEVILGAESMARMFFSSDGYNFLDRDMMLSIKGAVTTDVIKNFISVWDEKRSEDLRDVKLPVSIYLAKREAELKRNLRARDYTGWLGASSKNLCRFAEQMPEGKNRSMENLLVSLVRKSKEKVFLSGVKFDADSPVFKAALARATDGADFNFLGNGWEGGDGELTLYLDELIQEHPGLSPYLLLLRNWDVNRIARKRAQAVAPLADLSHVRLWSFFSFLHYKVALFDHEGFWVGSANPDWDSVTGYDESGIFCMDKTLNQTLSDTTEIDLSNSIPLSTLRH